MENKKLNIVLLTGSNPFNNSGILALDIFNSLVIDGHSVTLLTPYYDSRLRSGMYSICGKVETYLRLFANKIKFKLISIRQKTNPAFSMHSINEAKNYIPTEKLLKLIPNQIDIIIYLFPHNFLSTKNLYELNTQTKKPICVMPVDMAQLSGGCHYANDCIGFKHTCGSCPGLYSDKVNDLTFSNLTIKKKHITQTNLYTECNTWTSNLIKESTLFKDKPNYFCNVVIDETTYKPGDKNFAKNFFKIPFHKKIIFFGCTSINEKRKGFSYLIDALNLLYDELNENDRAQIGLAIAGNLNHEITDLVPFDIYTLGHLAHEELPLAFQMAELFASPSIQDAGPMMVVQSLMSGTPVVAFEIGNAVDFIFDDITGYRISLYDTINFKNGMLKILMKTTDEKELLSKKCREVALSKSSYASFSQNFVSNYNHFNTSL